MILNGCFERLENTGVISSNALQVFQANFLPLLRNADVEDPFGFSSPRLKYAQKNHTTGLIQN